MGYAHARVFKNRGGAAVCIATASTTREMAKCYEPSRLVDLVHEEVPFVNVVFNNSDQQAEELVDNLDQGIESFYDYFVVRVYTL